MRHSKSDLTDPIIHKPNFPIVPVEDRFVPLESDNNVVGGKRYGKFKMKYRCVDCGYNYDVDSRHRCK